MVSSKNHQTSKLALLLSHLIPCSFLNLGETISRTDVKKMSRANFMEILKGSAGGKDDRGEQARKEENERKAIEGKEQVQVTEVAEKRGMPAIGAGVGKNIIATEKVAHKATTSSWSALRDEYLVDSHMTLKDWDRDDDQQGSSSDNDMND